MKRILSSILIASSVFSITASAVVLKSDGWNLIGVCKNISKSTFANGLTGIEEIQSQSGTAIYIGDYYKYSDLENLTAGYGYWVKGSKDATIDLGIASSSIVVPLSNEGWNLMAACQDFSKSAYKSVSGIEEIQSQSGTAIYIGDYYEYSDLENLTAGYGYWVKGSKDAKFTASEITNDTNKTIENPPSTPDLNGTEDIKLPPDPTDIQ